MVEVAVVKIPHRRITEYLNVCGLEHIYFSFFNQVSGVTCQVPHVRCHVSCHMFHLSHITNTNSHQAESAFSAETAFRGQKDFVRQVIFFCFVAKQKKSVICPTFLWEAQPLCERPFIPVRDPASLWEAQSPCERLCLHVRGKASLWEARFPCERPDLPLRGQASL